VSGSRQGRVVALDVGERRVGIAISDPSRTIARPLDTVPQHPRPDHFAALNRLVSEHGATLVVVGQPLSLDGTVGPQARRIQRYQAALAAQLPVPVVSWDERYSTVAARDLMQQAHGSRGRGPRDRRLPACGGLDAAAAAVILQRFLDSSRDGQVDQDAPAQTVPPHLDGEGDHGSFQ